MASPTSQKADARPISFRLEDGQGGVTTVPLVIRPEELTRPEPAQQTILPTFGRAFMDDFGPGVSTIQISGHTGWGGGNRPDGVAEFQKLRDAVWTGWHAARLQAVNDGRDLQNVKLIFIDELDEITAVVAPGAFQLRRHRQRPLLMMYQFQMTVLTDDISPPAKDPLDFGSGGSPGAVKLGLSSLNATIGSLTNSAARMRTFLDTTVAQPLHEITNLSTAAFGKVVSVINGARGVVTAEAAQFVGMASDLALVGRNAFTTYNAVAGLPDFLSHEVSTVGGAFNNAFCVLRNAFTKVREYPDYDPLYGASNCSSTIGGSPISPLLGRNPWEVILPAPSAVASITPDARANIDLFKLADPVLRPMSVSELASRASAVSAGVSFPWL